LTVERWNKFIIRHK